MISLISSLADNQTWPSSTTRGRRLTFGRQPLLPYSMGREQGWCRLRANPGFGVFWFIPPSCPSLSLDNLLYMEDFPWSTQGRRDLSSCWVYRTRSWRLEGVRIWKLSRTYPGEKPPTLFILMHTCSLANASPHGTCWLCPTSLWGYEPLRGWMTH